MRGNEQITLPLSIALSPSLLNGGKRQGERKGKGRNPWPFAWFETGGSLVESKPLACLLSF